ncbi:MAG: high-affinity nickel-transporter [Acidobacteriota bacterium]
MAPQKANRKQAKAHAMKFNLIVITNAIILFAAAGVFAHPLGNFSVNQYSKLEAGKTGIAIRQVLDLAEIPTFQETPSIDADKDGTLSDGELRAYLARISPAYLANLKLWMNGAERPIRVVKDAILINVGAGGLQTLRIEWDLAADVEPRDPENKINFRNDNYPERIGWREIVVNRVAGVEVFNSSAFGSGVTDELNAYPQESLSSPLDERAAEFSFALGSLPVGAKLLRNRDGHAAPAVQQDRLAALISVPKITPLIALFGLLFAFGLGAAHAMSPGHGKTVVGAYLVGSKGTPAHAIFLGLTVTVTHTLGVFALGIITLLASNYILPETLMPFLSFFSGLIVLYIGLTMFKTRLLALLGAAEHHHRSHIAPDHEHDLHDHVPHSHDGHSHTHGGTTHTHVPPENITWKSLLALGVSGGLLPCPSALVLMLSAVNLNRVGYGLVLTLAFSFGLAATLTCVGLLFLYGGKLFDGSGLKQNPIFRVVPVVSAFVIACLGAVICYNSI